MCDNFIEPAELHRLMSKGEDNLVILHTSMANIITGKRHAPAEGYIPHAIHFDFEQLISDHHSQLPHTMPSANTMTLSLQTLGINQDSKVIVYDDQGLYCAPRVWFMLKVSGIKQVRILKGGLSAWHVQGYTCSNHLNIANQRGNAVACSNPTMLASCQQVKDAIGSSQSVVIDARSKARFDGLQAEPRQGLRSGHIPGSVNLPFQSVIEDGMLKPDGDLKACFDEIEDIHNKSMIFSCGSGVTACILALAAEQVGLTNWSVYDGSWSEWGASRTLPIESKLSH